MHRHHIIPKHQGGTDDLSNIVVLSIEDHAEAHRRLFEEFGRAIYTNGVIVKRYKIGLEPFGWVPTSVNKESKKNKMKAAYGRSWFNDGSKNYFLNRDDPLVTEMNLEKRRITA